MHYQNGQILYFKIKASCMSFLPLIYKPITGKRPVFTDLFPFTLIV